jgi:hypothetical protein
MRRLRRPVGWRRGVDWQSARPRQHGDAPPDGDAHRRVSARPGRRRRHAYFAGAIEPLSRQSLRAACRPGMTLTHTQTHTRTHTVALVRGHVLATVFGHGMYVVRLCVHNDTKTPSMYVCVCGSMSMADAMGVRAAQINVADPMYASQVEDLMGGARKFVRTDHALCPSLPLRPGHASPLRPSTTHAVVGRTGVCGAGGR